MTSVEPPQFPLASFRPADGVAVPSQDPSRWQLRVKILSATELTNPEYRLGDLLVGWVLGRSALISSVYIDVKLGDQRSTTAPTRDVDDGNARFADAQVLMSYREDPQAVIRVLDKRSCQAVIHGDPLIGEATLPLPSELKDTIVRSITLPIRRAGEVWNLKTGKLQLEYQLLKLDGDLGRRSNATLPYFFNWSDKVKLENAMLTCRDLSSMREVLQRASYVGLSQHKITRLLTERMGECMTQISIKSSDACVSRKDAYDLLTLIRLGEQYGVKGVMISSAHDAISQILNSEIFQCGICLQQECDVQPLSCCGRLESSNVLCEECISGLRARGGKCPFCRAHLKR